MKEKIASIIEEVSGVTDPQVSFSENDAFGDFATNIAFGLAKTEKKAPLEVAKDLAGKIVRHDSGKIFQKVEAASPGFINFWLKDEILRDELKTVLKNKNKYGEGKKQNDKIQLEFISANPTGPLTMANGRGGFMGDVLARVLEFAGHNIEREYYVNDTGNQILTLGKSILAAASLIPEEEKFYKAEYIKEWADKNRALLRKYEKNPLSLGQSAAKDFLTTIKQVVEKKAKIKFDRYTSEEKNIHKKGYVKKALTLFEDAGLVYKKDGAVWLKTTDFGDDKDRVLVTADSFPTYFLADAGHYLETKERDFDKKINILGPDHYGYVSRIQAAAKIVGVKKSETIVTQAVRIVENGVEVKMSKRKGAFITFEEVVDEVGADVARFFFLMHTPNTHMDFDLELAKERSMKNPVYYVQYAYVRAKSILEKSSKLKVVSPKLELLDTPEDKRLMVELVKFPDIVKETAGDYEVSRLIRYAIDLARRFHNFYEKEQILPVRRSLRENGTEKSEIASARLALIQALLVVFANLFDLLGIDKPKKM